MKRSDKVLTYAVGFALGCVILAMIPRGDPQPKRHPWHEQTALKGTYPMEVTDDAGRTVQFEKQPRHFISLAPSITEILFAMDMGDHLMAVTRWCAYPEEAAALRDAGAQVGNLDTPNQPMIAEYRPDLIIGTEMTPVEVYADLENPPGTVALSLKHEGMEDVINDIRMIGKVTGVPGKALKLAQELGSERQSVEAMLDAYQDLPRKRVLFLLSIDPDGAPGWSPGQGSWVDDLLTKAHAVNVTASLGGGWGQLRLEDLTKLDPDVILLRDSSTQTGQASLRERVASLSQQATWQDLTAVRTGRIHILPHGPLNVPGPRIVQAYRSIAEAIWIQE
jgi:iron complex transport system substrate-binding protein